MRFLNLLLGVCAGVLASCGGGGDSASANGSAKTVTISGTAATGMALSAAPVEAKCQTGTGTTKTAVDGTYTLVINNGALPCIVELTNPADRSTLHSVSSDSGAVANINITPLTELVVARLFRKDPATAFGQFSPSDAGTVLSSVAVTAAQGEVAAILEPVVGSKALTNFMSAPFKAANQDNPLGGDDVDRGLDLLKAKLNAGQVNAVLTALTSGASGTQIAGTVAGYTTSVPVASIKQVPSGSAGTTITLDGSGSTDAKGNSLAYQWTIEGIPANSRATLSSTSAATPTLTPDMPGNYVVGLIVNNGWHDSEKITITIPVSAAPTLSPFSVLTIASTGAISQSGSTGSNYVRPATSYSTFWDFCPTPDLNGCAYTTASSVTFTNSIGATTAYDIEMNVNDNASFPVDLYTQAFTTAPGSVGVRTRADLGKMANIPIGKSGGVLVGQRFSDYAFPGGSGNVTYTFNSTFDAAAIPSGWNTSTKTIISIVLSSSWTDSEGRPAFGNVPVYSKTFDGSFSESITLSKRLDDYPSLHGSYGSYAISITQQHALVRK